MSDNTPIFDKLVREYAVRGIGSYEQLVKPIPMTSDAWLEGFRPAPIIEEIPPSTIMPLHAREFPVPASIVEEQAMSHLSSGEDEEEVVVRPFVPVEGQPRGAVYASEKPSIAPRAPFYQETYEDGTEAFQPVFHLPGVKRSSPFDRLPKKAKRVCTYDLKKPVETEQEIDFPTLLNKYLDETLTKFRMDHPDGIITGFGESKMEEDGSCTFTVEGLEIADPEMAKRFTPKPHRSVANQPGEFEAGGIIFMDNEYQEAVNVMAPYSPLFEGDSEE